MPPSGLTEWQTVGNTTCHTPSVGLTERIVLAKLDQINVSAPPIPPNPFKTYSSDALETYSSDKALIAFYFSVCVHVI